MKPLVIALLVIIFAGTLILIILKRKAFAHSPANSQQQFSDNSRAVGNNDNIAHKPDNNIADK